MLHSEFCPCCPLIVFSLIIFGLVPRCLQFPRSLFLSNLTQIHILTHTQTLPAAVTLLIRFCLSLPHTHTPLPGCNQVFRAYNQLPHTYTHPYLPASAARLLSSFHTICSFASCSQCFSVWTWIAGGFQLPTCHYC